MAWVKIDDKLHENDKIVEASGDAVKLWVLALSWSNDKLTDGHLPLSRPVRLTEMRKPKEIVAELVRRRLWHQAAHPCQSCVEQRAEKGVTAPIPSSGYLIHHYFDYQRPAWVIREERQKRVRAGKRGADVRWGDGTPDSTSHGNSYGTPDSTGHSTPHGKPHGTVHGTADGPVPRTPYPASPVPKRDSATYPSRRARARDPEPVDPDPVEPVRQGGTGSVDPEVRREAVPERGLRHVGEVLRGGVR